MRLIVCGGRSFTNFELLERELTLLNRNKPISVLIHGWIGPAASMVEHWARANDIPIVRYPPNWELHGKDAETLRNEFMLCDSRPGFVVAFPGGPDTSDLVRRALSRGVAVLAVPGPLIGESHRARSRFKHKLADGGQGLVNAPLVQDAQLKRPSRHVVGAAAA
jgi:hypothetical protein